MTYFDNALELLPSLRLPLMSLPPESNKLNLNFGYYDQLYYELAVDITRQPSDPLNPYGLEEVFALTKQRLQDTFDIPSENIDALFKPRSSSHSIEVKERGCFYSDFAGRETKLLPCINRLRRKEELLPVFPAAKIVKTVDQFIPLMEKAAKLDPENLYFRLAVARRDLALRHSTLYRAFNEVSYPDPTWFYEYGEIRSTSIDFGVPLPAEIAIYGDFDRDLLRFHEFNNVGIWAIEEGVSIADLKRILRGLGARSQVRSTDGFEEFVMNGMTLYPAGVGYSIKTTVYGFFIWFHQSDQFKSEKEHLIDQYGKSDHNSPLYHNHIPAYQCKAAVDLIKALQSEGLHFIVVNKDSSRTVTTDISRYEKFQKQKWRDNLAMNAKEIKKPFQKRSESVHGWYFIN